MTTMIKAYTADKIFTGESWINDSAVIVENDVVLRVIPLHQLPAEIAVVQHLSLIHI